jgi:hypothetical protein
MPASRSRRRSTEPGTPPASPRSYGLVLFLVGLLAALGILISALPAGVLKAFLPRHVSAEDLSGTIWHGAAGKLRIDGRDSGAIEWQLDPQALLRLDLLLDLHWAHQGFRVDATADLNHQGLSLHAMHGGGPIDDLRDIGVASGWRGTVGITLDEVRSDFSHLLAVRGDLSISNLSATQFASGENLGSYVVHFPAQAIDAAGNLNGEAQDVDGPFKVQGAIMIAPQQRSGSAQGTLQERGGLSAPLRTLIDNMVQMRGRDVQGRIPIDVEFSF